MSYRNYYDSASFTRPRDSGRCASSISSDRPKAVTAKYINTTPSFKSSSIPILSNDRSIKEEPISAIANRYASYNKQEKPTHRYEKKDYASKLSIPSPVSINKSRDVSPVSTSSKYSLSRSSRHVSPDRRTTNNLKDKHRDTSPIDREKHIPNKTDKSTGYTSLSSFKLYSKTPSYSRPASRSETKPEITVNRYAIASRLSSNYLRSPTPVKRSSLSPVNNHTDPIKRETDKALSPPTIDEEESTTKNEINTEHTVNGHDINIDNNENIETVSVVTRHTSPTPPGSSSYVRSRRADMAKTVEKIITRARKKPEMVDKEIQSDRLDDPTRTSRFSSTSRTSLTNWTFYAPTSNNYTGYAGRYSTQYSNLRDNSTSNSYDRSSRSHSTEPLLKENTTSNSHFDDNKEKVLENNIILSDRIEERNNVSEPDKNEDIVINVNLKLKKAKSPVNSTELVSPEITITNSQLPPQAPKTDAAKPKKVKVRKNSTDSSSESSSKKKVLKKRSKSVSSTDSDPGSEKTDKSKTKESKSLKNISDSLTGPSLPKSSLKTKHSKSRESNSPESSITLSTQSSISEDESVSKSKTIDVSRTSADEISIPTDRSAKQSSLISSNKNEGGAEEAKSFLIRALAPVANLFKTRYQDSSENNRWLENSTSESTGKDISNLITESGSSRNKSSSDNIIASNDDNVVKLKGIRHIESGERAWWLDSESEKKNLCSDKLRYSSENQPFENSDGKSALKKSVYHDDEKPWWLDSSANIPEGIERLSPPRKSSSDSDKSEKLKFFKVHHIESGEKKDWWLTSNENSTNSISNKVECPNNINLSRSGSDQRSFSLRRIRHVESGERPWWLASDKNIPEGIEKLTTPPRDESDSSESDEVRIYVPSSQTPPFPLHLPDDEPLGDRRSPEGLETPKTNEEYTNRSPPYENNRKYKRGLSNMSYQRCAEKYISRYTDIDDILGTSGQIYSPFMDSLLARRTGQTSFNDDECEEIDPTQVRIHDSTAQMPVIKKLRCRSDIVDYREDQVCLFPNSNST